MSVVVETPNHNSSWPAKKPPPIPPQPQAPSSFRAISLSSAYVAASTSNQAHQNFIGGIRVPVNGAPHKCRHDIRPSTPPTSMPFRPLRQLPEPSTNLKVFTVDPDPPPRDSSRPHRRALPRRPSTAPCQPQRQEPLNPRRNNSTLEQFKVKTEQSVRERLSFFSKLTKSKPDTLDKNPAAVIVP